MTAVSVFFARLQYLNFQVEFTHRHIWKLLHLKNCHRYNVAAHPFQVQVLTLQVTPPTRAWGTLLAPAQFHNRSLPDPDTWQAPAQICLKTLHCWKNQLELALTHQSAEESAPKMVLWRHCHMEPFWGFLHVAQQTRRRPSQFHYISLDHPNAHELTNHILHPSPEPGLLSPGATGKWWHRWCGIVPVSPTGTTCSFPRILWIGITYRIGFSWSSS